VRSRSVQAILADLDEAHESKEGRTTSKQLRRRSSVKRVCRGLTLSPILWLVLRLLCLAACACNTHREIRESMLTSTQSPRMHSTQRMLLQLPGAEVEQQRPRCLSTCER